MNTIKGSVVGSVGGIQAIPSGSRRIVQSLKDILSCSEAEIYAALKDCNMDPNETVNRLLCQDPFHEVKSKREKKKEGKDINDSRPRSANNSSNQGSKNVLDQFHGRGGLTPNNSNGESSPLLGKSSFKKDNESAPYMSSLSSAYTVSGKYESKGSFGFSIGTSVKNEVPSLGKDEGMPSGAQPTSSCQSTWVGVPGQLSMADIVKMGRLPNKASNAANTTQHNVQVPIVVASHQTLKFSEDQTSKTHDYGVFSIQHVPTSDDWPSIETKTIPVPEYDVDFELHQEAPCAPFDDINRQSDAYQVQETEDETSENPGSDDVGSLCNSGTSIKGDTRGASVFENDLFEKMSSYQPQGHDSKHLEAEGNDSVPSVTRNLQQVSVRMADRGFPLEGGAPSVVIPDHLQVHSADFSHLSFGSFRPGISAAFCSGTMKSIPVKTNLGDALGKADASSLGHPVTTDTRNSEYFADDSLRNASDGSFSIRSDLHGESYDTSAASQHEDLKPGNTELAHGLQYSFPASKPSHTFADVQHLNAAYNQTSSQMEYLVPFSNAMHSYTNPLSSSLLAANVHPIRESDIQHSPFSLTHSTSSRYGNSLSYIDVSEISMPEAPKTSKLSSTQVGHRNLSGTSVATGPPLPQNLAVHPYSQPTLPLGPYGNMIGYPILPQSYTYNTYMPSAFQQTFLGNSTYHQSLAAMRPQYKNSASVSSLPQSAAIASGYGGFGSATTVPGNFPVNPPVTPSGTTLSYDDLLNSQFKDNNHLISHQRNENSPIWLRGGDSRTMLTVPANTYYSYQGQNQQLGGFRQGQQSSQNYGTVGHPTFYNSQTSTTQVHKNNSRNSAGSQEQLKQSQIWRSSY